MWLYSENIEETNAPVDGKVKKQIPLWMVESEVIASGNVGESIHSEIELM